MFARGSTLGEASDAQDVHDLESSAALVGAPTIEHARPFQCRLLDEDVQRRIRYFPRLSAVAAYVKANITDPVRLDKAASVAGMSAGAFSRYFAEKTGLTFTEFLKTMRIEYALAQLEDRDCAISQLAAKVGYRHGAFSRAFKDVVGATPSQYRRRHLFASRQEL